MGCCHIESVRTSKIVIFSPKSQPPDLSYPELCSRWCRWLVSIPKSHNPTLREWTHVTDTHHNIGKIVFLCQTFDFQQIPSVPTRSVTIPDGYQIFMPIINWVYALDREGHQEQENARRLASERMDEASNLRLSINGEPISLEFSNFRCRSVVNDVLLPHGNIFDMEPSVTSVVADGFWIFFRPLTKELILDTHGSCRLGRIQIAVSYHLTVGDK
ncbi:MAG: hypothetical protein WBX01_06415 [Nitrososphaeraceae archaeon]